MLRQVTDTDGPLQILMQQAKPLRVKLLRAANYLFGDHERLGEVVAAIRAGNGHMNKADDLGSLATLFTENWHYVMGRCDVTEEDVLQAQALGTRMLQLMGASNRANILELRDLRDRAGEYMRRGIEEIRSAAAFVFRHNPEFLERYPKLYSRTRKRVNGHANGEVATETETADEQQQVTPDEVPVSAVEPVAVPEKVESFVSTGGDQATIG